MNLATLKKSNSQIITKKRKNIEQTEKYCESDNDIEKLNKVSKKPEKKGTKS